MKKILISLTITFSAIFALTGCGNTAQKPSPGTTNTTAPTSAEPAKTILKPGDVNTDKPVNLTELVDSVAADKEAWKGKEVVVSGYVSGTSSSGDRLLLTIIADSTASSKKDISCSVQGVKSDEVFSKTVVVKGKIRYSSGGEVTSVDLEPCELKK